MSIPASEAKSRLIEGNKDLLMLQAIREMFHWKDELKP